MTKDADIKGFSGLSSLVSDISEEQNSKQISKPDISEKSKPPSRAVSKKRTDKRGPELRTKSTIDRIPAKDQVLTPSKTTKSSAVKWGWAIVILLILGIIVYKAEEIKITPSSRRAKTTSSPKSFYKSKPNTSPSKSKKLTFDKPPIGTNRRLSISQIRWCLREKIRLDSMRSRLASNAEIDSFNSLIDDYNSCCSSFRFRKETLEQAKREIEIVRAQIISEAIGAIVGIRENSSGTSYSNSNYKRSSSTSTEDNLVKTPTGDSFGNDKLSLIHEVQLLLKQLGYNPGPIDGKYGPQTNTAIRVFQANVGILQNGLVTEDLLKQLHAAMRR